MTLTLPRAWCLTDTPRGVSELPPGGVSWCSRLSMRYPPPMAREIYDEGERVAVKGYGYEMEGTVVGKTMGDSTRIKLDDGRTMLISNKIIRRL